MNYMLSHRKNLIKIQSLAYNQLSSPKFIEMIKYGWYKSGYTEELPENFENIIDFCFKNVLANCC